MKKITLILVAIMSMPVSAGGFGDMFGSILGTFTDERVLTGVVGAAGCGALGQAFEHDKYSRIGRDVQRNCQKGVDERGKELTRWREAQLKERVRNIPRSECTARAVWKRDAYGNEYQVYEAARRDCTTRGGASTWGYNPGSAYP